jgi:hypothetical protein
VHFDVADALEALPAVHVQLDAFKAHVVENRHHAAAHQDLAAGGVVIQSGRIVDRLTDEVARVARIDLRHADVHAHPHFDVLAGRGYDRIVAMALLHGHRPLGGLHRVVED